MTDIDHELEFLVSLDGSEFRLATGYAVRIEARVVEATRYRPHGVKYSLTLHDPTGRRIYGMDNAHGVRHRTEFDHRHVYGRRKIVGYAYRGPAEVAGGFLSGVRTNTGGEGCAMTTTPEKVRTGTFKAFQAFTLAVARGEQTVDPSEPKIWIESLEGGEGAEREVRFTSLEAGAKLLSVKNRELLRLIVMREPQSVSELADMAHRAPQNVQRTLQRLSKAGIVRLSPGEGRALRPILAARKVHIEIDLGVDR
jgi:predicted transcriptional regulator